MLTTIIAFAAVLFVLVMVHEWGHFFAARKSGMNVEEFGFGFPPRIASFIKKGTRYSFNWLPLGGFVKIQGENGDDDRPGSFATKSILKRLIVLSAGVIMNLVLAWVLLSLALGFGTPQAVNSVGQDAAMEDQRVVIGTVASSSPAQQAGIEAGDVILKMDGQEAESVQMVQEYTTSNAGQEITYTIQRNQETKTIKTTPRENPPEGEGALGVQLAQVANVSYPWYKAAWKGLELTWDYLKLTISGFTQIIGQLFGGPAVDGEIAGPVGIAVLTGRFAKMGIVALMQFTALLSINLAIINALPIPALDGGRILFLAVEAVRGKKVRAKVEQWSHAIGFALLLALLVVITIKDVANIF